MPLGLGDPADGAALGVLHPAQFHHPRVEIVGLLAEGFGVHGRAGLGQGLFLGHQLRLKRAVLGGEDR